MGILNKKEARERLSATGKRVSSGVLEYIEADVAVRLDKLSKESATGTISVSDAIVVGGFSGDCND